MKHHDIEALVEEHATIIENIKRSLEIAKQSLEDIRAQSFEVGRVLGRLLEVRGLSMKNDRLISKAGELLALSPFVDRLLAEKNEKRAS